MEDRMSKQLIWQERYNIGVDIIDKEHKKLFGILNRLFANEDQEEKRQWACQEGIKYFKEHAIKHFTEEETYMLSIGYAGFETHRRLHEDFRKNTLPALQKELMRTNYSIDAIEHFLSVCAGWLIGHTLIEDKAMIGQISSKWSKLLPEEEQEAMSQTICSLLHDMFQLDTRMISDCYGGEKFGKGIYYRMVYVTEQGEQWETILVFEEKLILKTIGSIMHTGSETVNVMLVNAVRFSAQQFANRVQERFGSGKLYTLKEENLLSYTRFQRIFERSNPQFTMLFDTGEGYFAFCVIASKLLQNDRVISLKVDNAVTEIQKYLDKGKTVKKNRILVVDDSDFVRKAMEKLLGKDYEVILAKSGLSAIRCITLAKPDLILLDYEMPVCDGRQVLEMIRTERDFADIPVIFLTGKTDKESVAKAVSLKPAGYLLKTLPPMEIKKDIDDYFKHNKAI